MELHRCRFVPIQPSAIHHIAVPPVNDLYDECGVLLNFPLVAVARANGDIELWNTQLSPCSLSEPLPVDTLNSGSTAEQTDAGKKKKKINAQLGNNWQCMARISTASSIEALVFAISEQDADDDEDSDEETLMRGVVKDRKLRVRGRDYRLRLFAGTLEGNIVEYDLDTLMPLHTSTSHAGGAVWSMSVCRSQKQLAVACEDGCIRLFDLNQNGLDYKRSTDKHSGRIVCVKWINIDGGKEWLVSGGSDGLVRVWDPQTGRTIQRMKVASREKEQVIIWDLLYSA